MLSRVVLRNFQGHKRLAVDFDPSVTTIIGPSDKGKSAVLRAIKWVCLNQPAGNDFLHHGAKRVSVTLIIDGTKVKRSHSNGKNVYKLNKQTYTAFGREVPEPVADFLRISNINFQGQHDAPFWFSETAGQVSRRLNQIVDLEIVDHALSHLGAELRASRTIETDRKEQLSKAKIARKALSYVNQIQTDFMKLKQQGAIAAKNAHTSRVLNDLVEQVSEAEKKVSGTSHRLESTKIVCTAGELARKAGATVDSLGKLVSGIEGSAKIVGQYVPDIEFLTVALVIRNQTRRQWNSLGAALSAIENKQNTTDYMASSLIEAKNKLAEITKERCPLCGQKTK